MTSRVNHFPLITGRGHLQGTRRDCGRLLMVASALPHSDYRSHQMAAYMGTCKPKRMELRIVPL
jgi:hypothetical protein